jgi:TonB family protein
MRRLLLLAWVLGGATVLTSAAGAGGETSKKPGTLPQVVKRVNPEYPWALRLNGNKGDVVLEFVVDSTGEVRNPTIIQSTHPEFEAPAIEALMKWKFKPAVVDGRPVNTRMRQPIHFDLVGAGSGAVDAFVVAPKAPKEFPEEFRYDKAPRPVLTNAPVYPFELLEKNVKGEAQIAFLVDPTGRTRRVLVHKATQPEFGAAAAAMILGWEFEPAQKDGKPSWAMLSMKQEFAPNERDSRVNESSRRLLKVLKKNPEAVLTLNDVDAPPKGRYRPGPALSEKFLEANETAEAMVEFIIDRAGRAQLPRVVSASNEEFGWAAATAVARWQFTPPTKDGKPVDVRARQPVSFDWKKLRMTTDG